jgi:hypothetical protein
MDPGPGSTPTLEITLRLVKGNSSRGVAGRKIQPMPKAAEISVSEHLKKVPSAVRPTVVAARRLVKSEAPSAKEVSYRMELPRSISMMWKIARYSVGGANVVGIGTFAKHSALFFYRGRELDDGSGLLQGGGKDSRFITLRSPADVDRPAVKRLVRQAFKLQASPHSGEGGP